MIPIELDQEIREGVLKHFLRLWIFRMRNCETRLRMHGRMRYRSTALTN